MMLLLALLTQAVLPSPNARFYSRTDYTGPGLVCGAGFSVLLNERESATLSKPAGIDSSMTIRTRDGKFKVHESQYITAGGDVVGAVGDGVLRLKRLGSDYVWIYRDNAPGSTDISGSAVNSPKRTPALSRIRFGAPRYGMVDGVRCLAGRGSGLK